MSSALLRKASALDDETDLELVTLGLICLKLYGPDYIAWESETLKESLLEDFESMGDLTWEKIQAVKLLHANNAAWEDWEVFEKICSCVSNEMPIFSLTQPPEPEDMAIALDTMYRIASHPISEDVLSYIASACLHDGLWHLPPPLDKAAGKIKSYDEFRNIERDHSSVSKILETRKSFFKDAKNLSEAQANRVLIVQKALKEYKDKLEKEIKTFV